MSQNTPDVIIVEPRITPVITRRELRYNAARIDVGPVGDIKLLEVSGAVFLLVGFCTTNDQILMSLNPPGGDFIMINPGDKYRFSPIERLMFKRNTGAGTNQLVVIYSNDPMFDIDFAKEHSGTSRVIWPTA